MLHTLPPKPQATKTDNTDAVMDESNSDSEGNQGLDDKDESSFGAKATTVSKAKSPPPTSTIPRLISVVEIIKREYFKALPPERTGLYQYNHLGYLEEDNEDHSKDATSVAEGDRAAYITAALQGKNL